MRERVGDEDRPHPPGRNPNAHRSFYTLAGLAWKLLHALKLLHEPAPQRRRTLVRHLGLLPVAVQRPARQLKASATG